MLFPPDLVPYLRASLPGHPALDGFDDGVLANLLTTAFFASLETEEGEYLPIRIVFGGDPDDPPLSSQWGILRWTLLGFHEPQSCTIRNLRRLSRATMQEWTFMQVAWSAQGLEVVGLARRGFGTDDATFLEIVAAAPGRLEVWSGRRRVLEYAQGQLIPPPENVILEDGPVQHALRRAAERAGVSTRAWPFYIDAIAAIIRVMATHGQGGILAISDKPDIHVKSGIVTAVRPSLLASLNQLAALPGEAEQAAAAETRVALRADAILEAALRSEIDRAALEIGGLTALDGATLLDAELAVRAFGVILPTAPHIDVREVFNDEPGVTSSFSISERGARHRAAAVLAHGTPDSLVFVASADGDLGCILREPGADHVVMWRFLSRAE